LRTIADSDLIAVVDKGCLVELGSPSTLLKNPDSFFLKLAVESNEFDEILNIASRANENNQSTIDRNT
jgi:ABC-type proline/glycine betaine transport system ATPase subunit